MTLRPTLRFLIVVVSGILALSACGLRVGTFTPKLVNGTVSYTNEQIATEAQAVGVKYARVQQVAGKPLDPEIGVLAAHEIATQLVVKSPVFGMVPPDLETFKGDVGSLLAATGTQLLAVQNEETVDQFWLDTPDNYLRELAAATEVAKAHHVAVTNGGIDRPVIALAVWNHLRVTRGTAYSDQFLANAFDTTPIVVASLTGVSPTDPDPYSHLHTALTARWREGEYLLDHYGTDPEDVPIDFVNFHWYVSDNTAEGFRDSGPYTDADALRDVVVSIREMTGKDPITNEIGQWGTTPAAPAALLGVLRDQLVPWAFWFDADGLPAHGLHNFDPDNYVPGDLRPNGVAFAQFVATLK